MNPRTRVTLNQNFTDQFGQSFQAGQTGTAVLVMYEGALVDFDGYEKERALNQQLFEEKGEAANILPWVATVPLSLLSENPASETTH